jgi:hypothetical protein
LLFALAGTAADGSLGAAGSKTRAERTGGVGDPRRTGAPIDAVFAGANQSPIFAARSQDGAADPLFDAEKIDTYISADLSWQES